MKSCLAVGVALSFLLAGCQTAPIQLRTTSIGETKAVATDAVSRLAIDGKFASNDNRTIGVVVPADIVCTEPSPDVAKSTAQTISASLSVLGQGSGALSQSTAQALVQLAERTASIQLIRDKMYQTCLAYRNGAITGTMYSVVMSDLDTTIVSLLLGETAGGAFGRSLAASGTDGDGEARATLIGLPDGIQDLSSVSAELDAKQVELEAKQKELDAENAKAEPDAATVSTLTSERDALKGERDAILDRLQSRSDSLAKSGAKASKVIAGGGIIANASPGLASVLSEMHADFLERDRGDTLVAACLGEMGIADNYLKEITTTANGKTTVTASIEKVVSGIDLASKGAARNTALSVYCQRNLNDILLELAKYRFNLKSKKLDLQDTGLQAKLTQARKELSAQNENLMKRCEGYLDKIVSAKTPADEKKETQALFDNFCKIKVADSS